MAPLSPHFSVFDPVRVPLIVLAEVQERSHPAASLEKSQWDGRPVQLCKVRIRVEQVLQGELPSKEVDVYYFANMSAGSFSTAPVWTGLYPGHSEIFFLQRDYGKLRTICDGWRSCIIWVRTGTHYNFKSEPGTPIEDIINRILLSRGDNTTDEQMIDAIHHLELGWGTLPVYNALREPAASDRSPVVRELALAELRRLQTCCGGLRRETPTNW